MAQKNFKWLLRVKRIEQLPVSRVHLKGICWEVDWLFPIWKTVITERKRKKKKLIGLLQFPWLDFLRSEFFWRLSYQDCCNLQPEPGVPGSECRSLGRLRCDSFLGIESPGRLRQVGFLRIGSLSRLRHVDFLGPLAWWIPEQVEAWQPFKDQIPRQLRQVDLLGPSDWSWTSPRSPVWPVLGRIKGM